MELASGINPAFEAGQNLTVFYICKGQSDRGWDLIQACWPNWKLRKLLKGPRCKLWGLFSLKHFLNVQFCSVGRENAPQTPHKRAKVDPSVVLASSSQASTSSWGSHLLHPNLSKVGPCPMWGSGRKIWGIIFVPESLKNSIWGCQWGLMGDLHSIPRLSTEKYGCRVNQHVMNCVHWGLSLNLKWWHSNKFITVRYFIGQVGIFCFVHKKMPAPLGANKLHLFELFI